MILSILHVFLFELKSHLAFGVLFFLQVIRVFLEDLEVVSKSALVFCLFVKLLLEFSLETVKLFFMFLRDFRDKHAIISFAAIL